MVDEYEDGFLPEDGHEPDEDYSYPHISEEEAEEAEGFSLSPDSNVLSDSNLQGTTSESDEVYQEADVTAVDELYSSPRSLDGDRTRSPIGSRCSSDRLSFDGTARQGSGARQMEFAAAPAAPAVGGGGAVALATPSTGLGDSRLWSVLAGSSPTAVPAQQQQPDKGRDWGFGGAEDLPPSLARGGSKDSTGTAATRCGAGAPATAGTVAAAGVGEEESSGGFQDEGGVRGAKGMAAARRREQEQQDGDADVYQEAAGGPEISGRSD
jgi:hypothetical protein